MKIINELILGDGLITQLYFKESINLFNSKNTHSRVQTSINLFMPGMDLDENIDTYLG